jgi:hypothetical protein
MATVRLVVDSQWARAALLSLSSVEHAETSATAPIAVTAAPARKKLLFMVPVLR